MGRGRCVLCQSPYRLRLNEGGFYPSDRTPLAVGEGSQESGSQAIRNPLCTPSMTGLAVEGSEEFRRYNVREVSLKSFIN